MKNPLVSPTVEGTRESEEYQKVNQHIDNELINGKLVDFEVKYGADFYVALERIAAAKTGYTPCPDVNVNSEALRDVKEFCRDVGVVSEYGGFALYRLVADAIDHHGGYENGDKLLRITEHYSTVSNQ